MNEEKVNISFQLANSILQFLGTKPYQEVFMLIQQLQAEITPQVQQKTQSAQTG